MNRHRDYGWAGRLGLGTPQGNPTVEAEFRRLVPASVEYCTLRLTSTSSDPRQRLIDYLQHLPEFLRRYAELRLDGFMFACTGSCYLLPEQTVQEYVDSAAERLDAQVILAADAISVWLQQQQATSIVLLSPYPDWLNGPAIDYWNKHGHEVKAFAQVDIGTDNTYAIYDQQSADAESAARKILDIDADAFVISGTGMPGLPLIKKLRSEGRSVVSSNLALAVAALDSLGIDITSIDDWALRN